MATGGDTVVHSRLGASSAERWCNCPRSVALSAGIPEKESAAAYRGSAMHALVDRCVTTATPADFWKGKHLAEWPNYTFKADDCDAVQVSIDFIDGLRNRPGVSWGIEQRFALADFDAELFGTNDLWAYDPGTQTLFTGDHKFGFGEVDAADNKQLKFYALGAMLALESPIASVETYIIQPADGHNPIKRAVYEPMDLIEFGGYLAERAEATRQTDAPLCAGAWCKFCKAAPACPALAAAAQAVAGADFADTMQPDEPPLLSSAELGDRLARVEVLKR